MAQLSILFNTEKLSVNNWYNADIEDCKLSAMVTRYTNSEFDILIWGDVSYKNVNKTIIRDLLSNNFTSYCGRSWILINKIA